MKWHAADDMPENRRLFVFVRDRRITIPATVDALAKARQDLFMVFRGHNFVLVYLRGRRI